MKRVWVPEIPEPGFVIALPEDEHHHLSRVRRIEPGETLEIVDGKGILALGIVVAISKKQTMVEVRERNHETRESPLNLQLFLALPHQKSTLDSLLPGLVQLGVNAVHLMETRFSGRLKEKDGKFFDRLNTIAKQSLKQCGRLHLPQLLQPIAYESALTTIAAMESALVFHPYHDEGRAVCLPEKLSQLALVIGPEGGLDEGEFRSALAAGIHPVALGPRILKMETCVAGACFWAQAQYGDFPGLREF